MKTSTLSIKCVRVLLALGLALCCSRAHAQPIGKTAVVPIGSPDARNAFSVADTLESKLTERRVALVPLHDARDRFTAHSRPPYSASSSDLDVLAREARQAIEHVAFGRTSAAQRSVREVMTRAEKTLESLNRETVRARQLLDACLALVRSQLHAGKRDEALDQAAACRRMVPDLAPSEAAHPPNVIGVLAEADDLMRRMRIGKLSVDSVPERSCSVFLNGRHLGTTPFVLERASAGEYRVQVECNPGDRGRVHVVSLGEEPVSLVVDTVFDQVVSSEPRLYLGYRDPAVLQKRAQLDASSLGQLLRADDVVLVRSLGEASELLRVNVQVGRVIARTVVLNNGKEPELSASWTVAIANLLEGRIEGTPSVGQALEAEPTVANAVVVAHDHAAVLQTAGPKRHPRDPAQKQQLRTRTGYTLGALAGALFVTGLALDARAHSLDREIVSAGDQDTLLDDNRRFDRLRGASWMGVAAGPVGIASALLAVRSRKDVPWWSYLIGGAGVASAGYAVYELASADRCELRSLSTGCLVEKNTQRRGAILLSASLPLLSVPLLHWWRRDARGQQLSVQATSLDGGGHVSATLRH